MKTKKKEKSEIDFFICYMRSSHPRVTMQICRSCLKNKKCVQYLKFIQPSLFQKGPEEK